MTARPGGAPPHPRSRALGLLVLALHLAGGLALHRLVRPPAPSPAAPTPVHVWISLAPSPSPPPPSPARRAAHEPAPLRPAAAPTPPVPRPGPVEPQAITLPAAAPPAAVDGPAPPAAAPAPAPLNLALPARPASSPPPAAAWTRNDPRVHDAPLDGEQRMARTLGTDTRLRSVSRGDGFELRRGNDCVNVQPSRAGQIFMPDGGARPPSQVGKC